MSFFSDGVASANCDHDDPETNGEEESSESTPPWEGPPQSEVPVVLPVSALIAVSEQAAMVLSGVHVVGWGVGRGIETKVRRGALSEGEWDDLLDRTRGFGHRRSRRISSSSRLRVGVELADGSRVLTDGFGSEAQEDQVAGARLHQTGGSGSGSDRFWVSSWTYWLWPLPADGPLTIVADWPQLDLAEGTVDVDGSQFAASAGRVRQIWPDADPSHRGPQPTWSISF